MKHVVTGRDDLFGPWIMAKINSVWVNRRGHTIGLLDEQKGITACAYLESLTPVAMSIHVASEGKVWLTREFLWFCFYYPFNQAGVKKLVSPVSSSNTDCLRFIENLGFTLEATLKDADPQGDLLLWTLTKDQCRWLHLRDKNIGQAQRT